MATMPVIPNAATTATRAPYRRYEGENGKVYDLDVIRIQVAAWKIAREDILDVRAGQARRHDAADVARALWVLAGEFDLGDISAARELVEDTINQG